MKKKSNFEKNLYYRLIERINENIVVVRFSSGNEGLLNITTNSFVGNIEYTECIYDNNKKFVALINRPKKKNDCPELKETISIYDVENNDLIVKDGEYEYPYNQYCITRNSYIYKQEDGYHIFDASNPEFRNNCYWFLYRLCIYNDALVLIEQNRREGIYKPGKGLILEPNFVLYDGFDREQGITFVNNENKQQSFMFDKDYTTLTPFYDNIKLDDHDFIICEKENRKDVYDKLNKKLLVSINCEEIEYEMQFGSRIGEDEITEYIFKIRNNGKSGLLKISKNEKNEIETEIFDMNSYLEKLPSMKPSLYDGKYDNVVDYPTLVKKKL